MEKKSLSYIEALSSIKSYIASEENKNNIQSGENINAFHASEIIAILFNTTKEKVINDIVNL